jgi:hypothetical protein
MTLINSTLIFGLVLATVPVILHMVMRARPKRIEFPALRLLKARQPSNARRMQLRHLLLLILRSLVIVILVIAIARPSLPAARYGLRWWEWVVLATAIAGSIAAYVLLAGRRANRDATSVDHRERKGRLRLWCLLGGLAATLIGVGIPWGLRVRAELLAPRPEASENIPVAAVFLVDTSYSMKYRHENRTRLEHSREIVKDHIGRLPAGSRAAISGATPNEDIIFQADLIGAGSRLETLETTAVPESLNRRIKAAIQTQVDDRKRVQEDAGLGGSADLFAREIYVLTDLSRTAWQDPDESGLSDFLKQHDWLQIYIVDVSVADPVNAAISNLRLSSDTAISGRDLLLTMSISTVGIPPGKKTIETLLIDSGGAETRFGAPQIVDLGNGSAEVQAAVRISGNQTYVQGVVRLNSEDPLPDDNFRYFSCGVRPRPKMLLISDRLEESQFIRNALLPEELERLGTPECEITTVVTAQVGQQNLAQYDAVFLVNCARPDESLWGGLKSFAESGGGVFVVAGSNRIQAAAWSVIAAEDLLPATPIRSVPFRSQPGSLRLTKNLHPLLQPFAELEGLRTELSIVAFDRRWAVEQSEDATVLLNYDNQDTQPALLERQIGSGRCLLFTSAMDNLNDGGRLWNNLTSNISFVVLNDRILQHLAGVNDQRRNFMAGTAIDLPVPVSQRFEQYLLRRPGLRQTRGALPPEETSLLLTDALDPGHYRIKPFESPSTFDAAFSVNFRDQESDLIRIPDETLQQMFGTDRVMIVHDVNELQRAVRVARLGVEVFPVLAGLLILLFCAEHLMANFFYDEPIKSVLELNT